VYSETVSVMYTGGVVSTGGETIGVVVGSGLVVEEFVKGVLVDDGSEERVVLFVMSGVEKPELAEEIVDDEIGDVVDARVVGTVDEVLNKLVEIEVRVLDEVVLSTLELVAAGIEELVADVELVDEISEELAKLEDEVSIELVEASEEVLLSLVVVEGVSTELVVDVASEDVVSAAEEDTVIEEGAETVSV
jgi:hypothetical protein